MVKRRIARPAAVFAAGVLALAPAAIPVTAQAGGSQEHGPGPGGYVYTTTNSSSANAVLAYRRDASTGGLTLIGSFPTGGKGTGDRPGVVGGGPQLGPPDTDQSLIVSPDRRFLFTVNERTDSIAVFRVEPDGSLRKAPGSPYPSLGNMPTSLGLTGNKLYVVNKDYDPAELPSPTLRPNYRGFKVGLNGALRPIPASLVTAPDDSAPTQALISPDGRHLFSSDFFAHQLRSLNIAPNGRLSEASGSPTEAQDYPRPPAFPNVLVGLQVHPTLPLVYVGQAANGLPNDQQGEQQVAVYSYDPNPGRNYGKLRFIRAVHESGAASCWFIVSHDGRWLYAVNTFDSSISVLSLRNPRDPVEVQHLTLSDPGTGPNQFALSPDGRNIYISSSSEFESPRNAHHNAIYILRLSNDGGHVTQVGKTETGPDLTLGMATIPAPRMDR